MALVASTKGKTTVTPTKAVTEVAATVKASVAASIVTTTVTPDKAKTTVVATPLITIVGNVIKGADLTPATKQLLKEIEDWYPDVTFKHIGSTYEMKF